MIDGASELCLALTVRLATEKILSAGALVAGITTKIFTYSMKILESNA